MVKYWDQVTAIVKSPEVLSFLQLHPDMEYNLAEGL